MTKIKAIAFDLDGTLIDSVPDITYAMQLVFTDLQLPICTEDEVRNLVGGGVSNLVNDLLQNINICDDLISKKAIILLNKHYANNLTNKSILYPNVKNTIEKLSALGYKLAIVTNKPKDFTQKILEHYDLKFEIVLGADSLEKMKPDPMPLLYILDKWDLKQSELLMVGDSKNDILAAKNANVVSCGVTYGYNYQKPIALSSPDFIIDDIADIKNILRINL